MLCVWIQENNEAVNKGPIKNNPELRAGWKKKDNILVTEIQRNQGREKNIYEGFRVLTGEKNWSAVKGEPEMAQQSRSVGNRIINYKQVFKKIHLITLRKPHYPLWLSFCLFKTASWTD